MKDRLRDSILGFIVGDAFGVPYEFLPRGTCNSFVMKGYGSHHQSAGTWSDDSSMVLAGLDAIASNEKAIDKYLDWFEKGAYTPHGTIFDIGCRTSSALKYYKNCGEIMPDEDESSLGNGSLMRILPFAFFDEFSLDAIDEISSYTHPATICKKACRIYVEIIRGLLEGNSIEEVLWQLELNGEFTDEFERLAHIEDLTINDIKSTGYVVDSLEAAIWSIINSHSFESAIFTATKLGNDTDTIAALTGGIAGIIYGENSIPGPWYYQIAKLDYIENLIKKVKMSTIFDKKSR